MMAGVKDVFWAMPGGYCEGMMTSWGFRTPFRQCHDKLALDLVVLIFLGVHLHIYSNTLHGIILLVRLRSLALSLVLPNEKRRGEKKRIASISNLWILNARALK